MDAKLKSLAADYLRLDRNPATVREITELVNCENSAKLQELLGKRLEFGTAGLRAQMGAGYARMNDLTVIQASQGIYAHFLKQDSLFASNGVVIGHDHRHGSLAFAQLTAAVFLSKNIKVHYFPELVHTPLVPFAVTHFKSSVGIMITASHNPKQDNGYKVYAGNGCQIIPPMDKDIAHAILQNLEPWVWDYNLVSTSPLCLNPTLEITTAYFAQLKSMMHFENEKTQFVKFCYTPMHGVGLPFAQQVFKTFSLHPFYAVPLQMLPDPDFPTVEYPNPEEGKGALKLAIEFADENDAAVIFANDPDADRLAVAEKYHGEWRAFNGNEIGVLLASFIIQKLKNENGGIWSFNKGSVPSNVAMITTTVSSHMIQEMAIVEGIHFEETLTGFKWLGNKAIELERKGFNVALAYEEAIGYMVNPGVRDKDGVSALGVMAEWTNQLYKNQQSFTSHLTSLYDRYGYFTSQNAYFICHDAQVIAKIFSKIRDISYPTHIAGLKVVWVRDLTSPGYDSLQSDNKPLLPTSSSQMITFKLENGTLITLRTSGTEPKIKYYTELKSTSLEKAQSELTYIVETMIEDLLEPKINHLQ